MNVGQKTSPWSQRIRLEPGKHDIHNSMDPDRMNPQVPRELADILARSFTIIERLWQAGDLPEDLNIENLTLLFQNEHEGG